MIHPAPYMPALGQERKRKGADNCNPLRDPVVWDLGRAFPN